MIPMIGPIIDIGDDKSVQVSSRLEISQREPDRDYRLISIHATKSEPAIPLKTPDSSLVLRFDDISSTTAGYRKMNKAHAAEIARYVEEWLSSTVPLLVVQCDAGISRSAATAAAILKWRNNDDTPIFECNLYHPNHYVYSLVLTALMGLDKSSE